MKSRAGTGGGKYKLAKNMALSGRVEDDVNARYESTSPAAWSLITISRKGVLL